MPCCEKYKSTAPDERMGKSRFADYTPICSASRELDHPGSTAKYFRDMYEFP